MQQHLDSPLQSDRVRSYQAGLMALGVTADRDAIHGVMELMPYVEVNR